MTAIAGGSTRPFITTAEAVSLAKQLYGLDGRAEELPGEIDRNFLFHAGSDQKFVLKFHGPQTVPAVLEFQNQALAHLARRDPSLPVPRLIRDRDGHDIAETALADGRRSVRLLTWLAGRPMGQAGPHEPPLLRSLGAFMARMDRALQDFSHPMMNRPHLWAMTSAPEHKKLLCRIEDEPRRALAAAVLAKFDADLLPRLKDLRWQVIHHDANDYNVLIGDDRRVSGIIDFGDMVANPVIVELAVTCAYAMIGHADPIKAILPVIAGYHDANPVTEDEIALLLDLVRTRLAQSVCMSSWQYSRDHGNTYLLISQKDAWDLLERLTNTNERFALFMFRNACGFPANPATPRILSWLARSEDRIGPLCRFDFRRDHGVILDFSHDGEDARVIAGIPQMAAKSDYVARRIAQAGASHGIGRYREDRSIYDTELFATGDHAERRTVHLGIDVFMPAGEPISAPIDGRVHLLTNNDAAGDYGPLIVLRHETDDDVPFWTLYGHLAEQTLNHRKVGESVKRGDIIGWIGNYPTNGNWPPHLHFQIITDFVGRGADIEGVAKRSEIEVWESISPDPNIILGMPGPVAVAAARDKDQLRALRDRHLSPSLSLSYAAPLKIVRGAGQFLYDEGGRPWLDMVNNVAHVGHCHPRVVKAGQDQMAVLNTNTRYLHDNVVEYARRLTETLPAPLNVCFFVNSGSEANDLALRLARAHTGRRDILVVDVAYHGNLGSLVDISPYKFNGPGGKGCPDGTWVAAKPDGYRGCHKYGASDLGQLYSEDVRRNVEAIQAADRGVAAFFCESVMSCAGQVVLPDGYLKAAYESVRAAGGLCVADEVQVGFGRVGGHMWAFETQGVVPDIVTLGKPIGNGHPLAAVVTTPEIAASFANGMEYFNTFGGNPVSAAIGLAVLDVIRDEHLQHRALETGQRIMAGLEALKDKFALIGDVRGLGLFIGIELVKDRTSLEPAPRETKAIIEAMKRRGILLSIDGPLYNVIKIKPPMVFNHADCDQFLAALGDVLGEMRR
ncbi:MAG: aminotransferase class III-fold pyridoxal phosphate-dependent enzyme [Dongiaceae bacterium]